MLIERQALRVSMFDSDYRDRPAVEAKRKSTELIRKVNTLELSQIGNRMHEKMHELQISISAQGAAREVNGVRLFTHAAMNALLKEIYALADVKNGYTFQSLALARRGRLATDCSR